MPKNPHAVALGSIRSPKKAQSSRQNGKLGGRPKKPAPIEPYELPCGCALTILPGGVVDEVRCADHSAQIWERLQKP